MEEDARSGKPLRAAVLRQKVSSGGLPAAGFFAKAAALGYRITDPGTFVQDQRRRLMDAR
jgi:hypothetical protein